MSGTNPIQNNPSVVIPPNRSAAKPAEARVDEQPPQDSFQVSSQPQAKAPASNDTQVITVRMEVKKELLQPDPTTGETPLDSMSLDLVPAAAKGPNAPVFIDALQDPAPVEGYVAKSTVALVAEHLNPDSPEFKQNYFATFVPQGGYVLSQGEIDEYSQEQQEVGFQKGLSEGVEKGKKEALPPGFQAKLADSKEGAKWEQRRDMGANLLGLIGSNAGALGISAGTIPLAYATPLAFVAAPLQVFGPNGTFGTISKLENQRQALLDAVAADNQDGSDPMKAIVDMNPHTLEAITTEDALKGVDVMVKAQKMKTVGAALLAGAGVAAIAGFGPIGAGLAIGSMLSPLSDQLPTFDKIGQTQARKKELKAMLEAGIEKVSVQVPVHNSEGVPIGFKADEIPVQEALDHVAKQQKLLGLGATSAALQVGCMVAMGLGAPMLVVGGATILLPMLAKGAFFPKESWESLKALPGQVWDGIKAVATAIGRKVGLVKDGKPEQAAQPMSDAQKQLFSALKDVEKADPGLANALRESIEALHKPPQNEEEQKAAIQAGVAHQAQLKELETNHPELAEKFKLGVQAVLNEGLEQIQQAEFEANHDRVEQAVESEFTQSLLNSDRVKSAIEETGQGREFAEGVVRLMAQAEIFGDSGLMQQLKDDNKEARQQLKIYEAISAELNERAAASGAQAA